MVPNAVTSIRNMSALDKNGILTIHDMAEKDYFKFYQEEKYWNVELKEEFRAETMGLWTDTFKDKYAGNIFAGRSIVDEETELYMLRVDREMQAAVRKYGKATLPSDHIEDFYNNIEDGKRYD